MAYGLILMYLFFLSETGVIVSPFSVGKTSQQWRVEGNTIQHRLKPNWVLSVQQGSMENIQAREHHATPDQHWTRELV